MAKNEKLRHAKKVKQDEYYTGNYTVGNEMAWHRLQFQDKIVYCNCDDPTWSSFWVYFHNNFTLLGLKKLISTHYTEDSEPSYKMEYTGGNDFDMDC